MKGSSGCGTLQLLLVLMTLRSKDMVSPRITLTQGCETRSCAHPDHPWAPVHRIFLRQAAQINPSPALEKSPAPAIDQHTPLCVTLARLALTSQALWKPFPAHHGAVSQCSTVRFRKCRSFLFVELSIQWVQLVSICQSHHRGLRVSGWLYTGYF